MNEQLQKALAEIIRQTMNGLDAAVSFLSSELPDVIHQLLIWYAVKNGVYFLVGLVVLIVWLVVLVKSFKYAMKAVGNGGYAEDAFVAWFLLSLVGSIPFIASCDYLLNLTWLQIILAPKIWLIEYAAKLVK